MLRICAIGVTLLLAPTLSLAYVASDPTAPVVKDQQQIRPRVQIIMVDAEPQRRQRARLVYLNGPEARRADRAPLDGCLRQTGSRIVRPDSPDQRCVNALPGDVYIPIR